MRTLATQPLRTFKRWMLRQLFDTFTGATRPSKADRDWTGRSVLEDEWVEEDRADAIPVAQVDAALASTGYNRARFHYVEGDVRETLPARPPMPSASCASIPTTTTRPCTN